MNIESFIKNNIKMLDNNSISIDHLVNKLYVTVLREKGIERTKELEKNIRDVFVKYKRKEINVNETTQLLNPIISGDKGSNDNVSVTPKTETPPKSETPPESGAKGGMIDKTDSGKPQVEKKVEIKKDANIDPAIKQGVKKNLGMLDNNSISVDNLANKMAIEIRNDNGANLSDDTKNDLKEVLRSYKKGQLGVDEVATYYNSLLSGKKTYVQPKPSKKKEELPKEEVVDVDPDQIMEAADKLGKVESSVGEAKIDVPDGIAPYAEGIQSVVTALQQEIGQSLEENKSVLYEILDVNEEIDGDISGKDPKNITFVDISKFFSGIQVSGL